MSAEDVKIKNKEAVQNETHVTLIKPTNSSMLIPHLENLDQDLAQKQS